MGTTTKTEQVERYERLLKLKKKYITKKKKNLPYYVGISILLFLGLFNHLENLFNNLFGPSVYLILILIVCYVLLCIAYIFFMLKKIQKTKKDMRSIKIKMYNLMKLENNMSNG